jgi:hypothetical protein
MAITNTGADDLPCNSQELFPADAINGQIFRQYSESVKGGVKPGQCGGPYIYSAAMPRSRGALCPIFSSAHTFL